MSSLPATGSHSCGPFLFESERVGMPLVSKARNPRKIFDHVSNVSITAKRPLWPNRSRSELCRHCWQIGFGAIYHPVYAVEAWQPRPSRSELCARRGIAPSGIEWPADVTAERTGLEPAHIQLSRQRWLASPIIAMRLKRASPDSERKGFCRWPRITLPLAQPQPR